MTIACLSGWGQPDDALQVLAPQATHVKYAHCLTLDEALQQVAERASRAEIVIGWSLGGRIALEAASQKLIAPRAMMIIAAPLQFVRSDDFHDAMPADIFMQFYENYRSNPARTAARFAHLIAKGDAHYPAIADALKRHRTDTLATWQHWLDVLAELAPERIAHDALPYTLYVHGDQDTIVPVAQSRLHHARHPGSDMLLLPGCAHAPHLHATEQLRAALDKFMKARGG